MKEKKIEKAKKKYEKLRKRGGFEKVMKVLRTTSDQALLAYVAAHEHNEELSREADYRLTDGDTREYVDRIQEEAKDAFEKAKDAFGKLSGYDEIMGALRTTSDQALLAYVAAHEYSENFTNEAFRHLTDRDALEYVLNKGREFSDQSRALDAIGYSQEELKDLYRTSRDVDIKGLALRKIEDQSFLIDVLEHSQDDYLRSAAIANLTDQPTLIRLAAEEADEMERERLVGKVTDQDFLKRVFLEDDDKSVRMGALERIDDPGVLAQAAKDDDYQIRDAAAKRLEDQALLLELAENDDYDIVRRTAAKRITDADALEKLLESTMDWEVKNIALKAAGRGLEMQRRLVEKLHRSVKRNDDHDVRRLMGRLEEELTEPVVADEAIDAFLGCLKGGESMRMDAADSLIRIARERPEVLKKHWNALAALVNEPVRVAVHEDTHVDTTDTQKLSCATDEHTDMAETAGIGKEFPPYPG